MTSFITVLGAAGIAIGMAFSGTLSNFAGGIMILVLKPFKVGDTINAQGQQGTVKEIQIFNTYIHSADNKVIILPNGPVANGSIVNISFPLAYGTDINLAFKTIEKVLNSEDRILKTPSFVIALNELNDSGLNIVVMAWADHADFNQILFKINKEIYQELTLAGINFVKS